MPPDDLTSKLLEELKDQKRMLSDYMVSSKSDFDTIKNEIVGLKSNLDEIEYSVAIRPQPDFAPIRLRGTSAVRHTVELLNKKLYRRW